MPLRPAALMPTMLRLACFFLLASAAVAQHENTIEAGRAQFVKMCSGCHGDNAKGGRGSDLTTGKWKWGGSDDEIIRNIQKGIPGTQMPPFPVSESEARTIAGFLRSLSSSTVEDVIKGDPQSGRKLFFGSAQCSRCHMFSGTGGRLGPDLTLIREQKKAGDLRKAITEPHEPLRAGFETVEVTRNDGTRIRGTRKYEDTFSIQLMDERERLHLLLKKDLREVHLTRASLMPAIKLQPVELDNVVAFLKKGAAEPPTSNWEPSSDFNVTFARLKNAEKEPQNWLTYWGNYRGTHYSDLDAITPHNVRSLASQWSFQFGGPRVEVMPIVVNGLMFVTGPLNDAAALDARTGQPLWRYRRKLPEDIHAACTVMTNRGFGILGDRLYLATLDTHLVALDAKTGSVIWDVKVDDYEKGYSITHAPLALDGKIIVGVTAGECGLNAFVDAYDAATGKRLWRFWAIPQKGDPARATWAGNSADTGGGPTWMTGTYDAETETLFWTTGNPAPDYDGSIRMGDNLYTCSVLALNPNTGKLKWHFQFTPHDTHDWDSNETPVLIDAEWKGRPRKLLIQANRNAFFYVLDRLTGEFLLGKAFVKQTWAQGLDAKGRPILVPGSDPTPEGNYTCPDASGGANWAAPSYDRKTGLFFVPTREVCAVYSRSTKEPVPGLPYNGSGPQETKQGEPGAIKAIDPLTGDIRWEFKLHVGNVAAGVLGTAGGLLFACSGDGYLIALDAGTGKELWHFQTGAEIRNSPISYSVDGRQYIAVAGDSALFTFALP